MEGFSIDGNDDNVDYGKVLIFIQENRLHQVGITANQVRKRLEAEGKLKDLEIAKKEEEKKDEEEKPTRISNLLKLYSRTIALTKKKPDPKKDVEEKKDDGAKPDDDDKSKDDGAKPVDGDKSKDHGAKPKDGDKSKDEAKKNVSDDKSSPTKEVSTPQPDSPKAEDGKASDATEEDIKTGEPKIKSADTMKKLSSLFRFFNKPPGKEEKHDPSDQADVEDAAATKESKIKDKEVDMESPANDKTTSQAEPSKDPTTENEAMSDKATKEPIESDKKDKKSSEDAEKPEKPGKDNIEFPKKADTDQSDVELNTDTDKSMKNGKKSDAVKEKDILGKNKKETDADKKTPEKIEGLLDAENKLSSLIGSDQAPDEKGSHIEEYIPDYDDELLDSPKDIPESNLEGEDRRKTENDKDPKLEEASHKLKSAMSLLGDDDASESADKLDDKETEKPDDNENANRIDEGSGEKSKKTSDHPSPDAEKKEIGGTNSDALSRDKSKQANYKEATKDDSKERDLIKIDDDDDVPAAAPKPELSEDKSTSKVRPGGSTLPGKDVLSASGKPNELDVVKDKDDNKDAKDQIKQERSVLPKDEPKSDVKEDASKDKVNEAIKRKPNELDALKDKYDNKDAKEIKLERPVLPKDEPKSDVREDTSKDKVNEATKQKPNELDAVKDKDNNKDAKDQIKQERPVLPKNKPKSDVNEDASKDKVNKVTKVPEPQSGHKSSGKSGTAEEPKNKSLSVDADAIETMIDLNSPEFEKGSKTGNDKSELQNELIELKDLKPSKDAADDKKTTTKRDEVIESLESKDEDKASTVDSDPTKIQKPEDKSLSSLKDNLDPSKKKSHAEDTRDKSAANDTSKAQETKQKPKQAPTKATPVRKGSTVKISGEATTIDATKKLEKAKSSEKLKVPEKNKPKEIVKAASSDKIKESSNTSSAEKLRSTEKLASNKDKVPEKLSGRSKSSDKLRSSEKLRDKDLSTKRRSLQPSTPSGFKDSKTGRPRSVSLKPEIQSSKKKVPDDKKDQSKERQQNQGETMRKKTPSAEWRKSGNRGGANEDKLTGIYDDREPCDEKRIKRRRKHRRQVTELVEIDKVLVLRTRESYTSGDDDEDSSKFDESLENGNLEPPSKRSSAVPKSSKSNQNASIDFPESNKNAIGKVTDSSKKPTGKQQSRTSNSSKSAMGTKNRPLSPERETKRMKAGKQHARDEVVDQDPFYPNWREGIGTTEVRLDSQKGHSHLFDGNVSETDSSLEEEWFDTKSQVSTDWYDAKSHVSVGDPYQEWDVNSSMPPLPGYKKTQRYADPRLAYLDRVDNSYYSLSVRNSRIPVPSRGHNSANESPYLENKTLLDSSPTRYPNDKYMNSRSRSKSPIKLQEERLSPWTPGESSRKRPPIKSVINKPMIAGQKEYSNISCLKMDKNRAETLKAIRPAHLKTDNQMPLSRIQPYLKPVHNYEDANDARLFRSTQKIPYIQISEVRIGSRNPSKEAFQRPRYDSPSYKRASPSPTRQDQKRYSPQPPPSPYRNRPIFENTSQKTTRRSHNDLLDEPPEGTYLLNPRGLCPQNLCRSRCTCLSRSADDLADFSNSSSILKLTFVPPNRKPPWRL